MPCSDPASEQGREASCRCRPTFSCAAGLRLGGGDPDERPPFRAFRSARARPAGRALGAVVAAAGAVLSATRRSRRRAAPDRPPRPVGSSRSPGRTITSGATARGSGSRPAGQDCPAGTRACPGCPTTAAATAPDSGWAADDANLLTMKAPCDVAGQVPEVMS
jgi:hypothetical protein